MKKTDPNWMSAKAREIIQPGPLVEMGRT